MYGSSVRTGGAGAGAKELGLPMPGELMFYSKVDLGWMGAP